MVTNRAIAPICAFLAILSIGAGTTQPADKLTQTWAIPVTSRGVTVTVHYPSGWKQAHESSGAPFVYQPGKGAETLLAQWEFDIKSGTAGRTLDQLLDQISKKFMSGPGTKIIEQKIVDLDKDRKAASLVWTRDIDGIPMTMREFFYFIDGDRLIVASENAPTSQWDNFNATLNAISRSLLVEPITPSK